MRNLTPGTYADLMTGTRMGGERIAVRCTHCVPDKEKRHLLQPWHTSEHNKAVALNGERVYPMVRGGYGNGR